MIIYVIVGLGLINSLSSLLEYYPGLPKPDMWGTSRVRSPGDKPDSLCPDRSS